MIPRPTRLTSRRPSVAPFQRRFESLTHKEVFSERNPDLPLYALREAAAARASSSSSSSSSSRLPARKRNTNPLLEYEVPQSDDLLRRTERRSPAAVFGARKMPRISIPSELENKLERLVGQQDMALTKRCYNLFLPPPDIRHKHPQAIRPPKPSASTNLVPLDPSKRKQTGRTGSILDLTLQPLRVMPRQTTKELIVAHAAAELPTQYAILRTLMRELQTRYGWDALESQGRIQIVDFAALYGAAAWASVATLPSPVGRKNALVLIENNSVASDFSKELLTLDTPGPLATWSTLHFRSFAKYASSALAPRLRKDKSVGVLAFALSALVDPKERRRKLKEVWNSGVETIVVAEMGHRDGWTVVEEAREYLLGLGREELAVGQDQAGEYTPPSPPVQKDEQPGVDTSTLTPLAPRPRGRRRPGERLRPATPPFDDAPLNNDVEAGQFGIDKNAGVFVDTRRKKEKFVFNGVEFEEEDRKSEQEESEESEVVRWNDEGTQLVKDGRVLGCHIVAPCPHDQKCPLASTPTPCAFGQLLETPLVTRLTKSTKSDLSRLNYSYFILRRGPRPAVDDHDRGQGREGEVGREERAKLKEKAKDVAVQGEDGMFALRDDLGREGVEEEEVDWVKLRREVGEWGRVIRSPLARKGHVEVDMCTAQGEIQRKTFSKKLGKQVWYDTSHIQEGDAFPHSTPITSVRERGITHLAPAHKTNNVTIKNGKVTGLDKLRYVEWKEVHDMMAAMGVSIPEFDSGKRSKNKKWVVEYSDEIEQREGWEPVSKTDRRVGKENKDAVVKAILGGEEETLVLEDTTPEILRTTTRPRQPLQDDDEDFTNGILHRSEFEPTSLLGAQEVVPPSFKDSLAANPDPFDLDPSSDDGEFSIASSVKVDLSGLGPGWMEEFSEELSLADRKAAARDRKRTFDSLGIYVPEGQGRTLKDDWDLLEKWDGQADETSPERIKPRRNPYWLRRDWRQKKQ